MSNLKRRREPLHREIADELRSRITRSHKMGDRLESERALAEDYGVSLLTIREAMSVLQGEGLIERRHGSGTYVTDRGGRGRVGVLLETDFADPRWGHYPARVAQCCRERLGQEGVTVRFYAGFRTPEDRGRIVDAPGLLENIRSGRLNGLITVLDWDDRKLAQEAEQQNVSIVNVGPAMARRVEIDRGDLYCQGITHLAAAGCQRPLLIGVDVPHDAVKSAIGKTGISAGAVATID
ncbi:MAG: GntR family transcriptional regulator, partial [Phycisphaeraceae bacterium]|nr:GntR family transcriptional regulator [Phycisphaeraceae bacterium]